MLKYLVGTFDEKECSFSPPFVIVRSKTREVAGGIYDRHFGLFPPKGRVMALVTLLGPFNLDKYCNHAKAVEALGNVSEELQ